jgi:membrane-associated phospholipid phosphatase
MATAATQSLPAAQPARRDPRWALLAAAACATGFAATGAVALLSPFARAHDVATASGFESLAGTRASSLANGVAHVIDPSQFVVIALLFAGVALLRGRPRVALIVPATMVAAVATAELLKPLLALPRGADWLTPAVTTHTASWPSGHTTAAMVIAMCGVVVAPRALRPLAAALGSALAIGVGYSVVMLGWHLPSDVLGGILLAATWSALAVALLWWADARWPARTGRAAVARGVRHSQVPALAVGLMLMTTVALFIARSHLAGASAVAPKSFTAAALIIAALAAAPAAALAFALRREGR